MSVQGKFIVYRTTHLCLTVNKLTEETKREQLVCKDVSVYEVYILSTVETEDTCTPARLEALLSSTQSSVPPVTISPRFFGSDCVRGPSENFVKRSAVLFFGSTTPTERHPSLIHGCMAKQRIAMCLSPPGPSLEYVTCRI